VKGLKNATGTVIWSSGDFDDLAKFRTWLIVQIYRAGTCRFWLEMQQKPFGGRTLLLQLGQKEPLGT